MNAPIQSFFTIPKVRFAFFQFTGDELLKMAAESIDEDKGDEIRKGHIGRSLAAVLALRELLMGLQFGDSSLKLNIILLRDIMRGNRDDREFLVGASSSTDIFIDEIFSAIKCFPALNQIIEDSKVQTMTTNKDNGEETYSIASQYSCVTPEIVSTCIFLDGEGVLTVPGVRETDNSIETLTNPPLFSVCISGCPEGIGLKKKMLVGDQEYTLVASYSFEPGHGINGHFTATRRTVDGRGFHHFDDLSTYDARLLRDEDIMRIIDKEGMAYYVKNSELDRFYPRGIQIPKRVCDEIERKGLRLTPFHRAFRRAVNQQPPMILAQPIPKIFAVQVEEQLKLTQQREKIEQERIANEKMTQEKIEKKRKQDKDRLSDIILFAQSRMNNDEINACASETLPDDIKLIKLLNIVKSLLNDVGKKVEDRIYDPLVLLIMAELDCECKPSIGLTFTKFKNGFNINDLTNKLGLIAGYDETFEYEIVFKGVYEKNIESLLGYIKGDYIDVDKTHLWIFNFANGKNVEIKGVKRSEFLKTLYEMKPTYYDRGGNIAGIEEVRGSLLDTINQKLDSISKKLEQEKEEKHSRFVSLMRENAECLTLVDSAKNSNWTNADVGRILQNNNERLNILKTLLGDKKRTADDVIFDPLVISIAAELNCRYKPTIGVDFRKVVNDKKSITISTMANTPAREWAERNKLRIGTNIVFEEEYGENVESCLGHIIGGYIDINRTKLMVLNSNNEKVEIKDVGIKKGILDEFCKINPRYCNADGNNVEPEEVRRALLEIVEQRLDFPLKEGGKEEKVGKQKLNMLQNTNSEFDKERKKSEVAVVIPFVQPL
jgi:hypothetical protein